MRNLIAKYRALLALVMVAFVAAGCQPSKDARKANTAEGVQAALELSHRFGAVPFTVTDGSKVRFGAATPNTPGWTINSTTKSLVAPSGAIIEGVDYKPSGDACATSNQATLTGLAQTIDTIALSSATNTVWLFGQTTTTEDGCYHPASGAWTRCAEASTGTDLEGAYFACGGSTNKGVWLVHASGAQVVGTNDLTATNLSSGGGTFTGTAGTTDNRLVRADGTAGTVLQGSTATLADTGLLTGVTFNDPAAALDPVNRRFHFDPHPEYIRFVSEFSSSVVTALSTTVAIDGFTCSAANSGTCTVAAAANDLTHVGIVQLTTVTSTSSVAALIPFASSGGNGGGTVGFPTTARVVFDFIVNIATASDGTNTRSLYLGTKASGNSFPLTTAADGCAFRGDQNADTHWTFSCCSTGTTHCTTLTSTATINNGTYQHLRAVKDLGADTWTSVTLDGVAMGAGTIAADVPTAAVQQPFVDYIATAGTASRVVNVDEVAFTYYNPARVN